MWPRFRRISRRSGGSPAAAGSSEIPVTWNPSDSAANLSFSAGNTVATSTSAATSGVRSVQSVSSGKRYLEFLCTTIGIVDRMGFANSSWTFNQDQGENANSAGLFSINGTFRFNANSTNIAVGALANGDVVMIAYDITTGKVWTGKNGVWQGDPAAGTDPVDTIAMTGPVYAAAQTNASGSVIAVRGITASFSYPPPTGFVAWGAA